MARIVGRVRRSSPIVPLRGSFIVMACAMFISACGPKNNGEDPDTGVDPDANSPDVGIVDGGDGDGGDGGDAPDAGPTLPELTTISADVTARYDIDGILHIQCEVARDCFVAQGYLHAADRFVQMDLTRNQTLGRLSSMVGFLLGAESDLFWRHITSSRDGTPLEDLYFDALDDDSKDVFVAYSEGVNAWLDDMRNGRNGAKLSEEYESPLVYDSSDIVDWAPQDAMAPLFQISYQLGSAGVDRDLIFAELLAEMDENAFLDLMIGPPAFDSPVVQPAGNQLRRAPQPFEGLAPEQADRLRARYASSLPLFKRTRARLDASTSLLFGPRIPNQGSNGWIVGPERVEGGGVLLANDPHLQISNPAAWYPNTIEVTDGSLYLAGLAVPGGPGIVLGHNNHIAWGATVAMYDLSDAYLETLSADGTAVIRDGQEIPILRKETDFAGNAGQVRTEILEYVPDHGPILMRDDEAGTAVTMKWSAQEGFTDARFLRKMWYAQNVDEAETALSEIRAININWMVGDTEGSIGWFPAGAIPDRGAWASMENPLWLPLSGDGSQEWTNYVDRDALPSLKNPAANFIVTTNNDFTGRWSDGNPYNEPGPPLQQVVAYGTGHRSYRASELIRETSAHTPETMRQMHGDIYSLHGATLVPEVLTTAAELDGLSTKAQAVVTALGAWDFTCPTALDGTDPESAQPVADDDERAASAGCAAFHVLIRFLTVEAFQDEFPSWLDVGRNHIEWQDTLIQLYGNPEVLITGEAFFDDISTDAALETRADVTAAALERTGEWLTEQFESETATDWIWGRLHLAEMPSLLGLSLYGEGPFVSPGGMFTLNMGDPERSESVKFHHLNASSLRTVFHLTASGIESSVQMPGGTTHQRDSDRYLGMTQSWLENTPIPFRAPADVEDAASETIVLQKAP